MSMTFILSTIIFIDPGLVQFQESLISNGETDVDYTEDGSLD